MKAYYTQITQDIFPIYGVNSLEEAKRFVPQDQHNKIVETEDEVYMNTATGSVDFESNWVAEGVDLADLVEVSYDSETESWVEKNEV